MSAKANQMKYGNVEVEIVGTYPTPGDGISKYIRFLVDALEGQKIVVHTTRIFFLRNPWSTFCWLSIKRFRSPNIHVQYTPTGAGPFFLFFCLLKRSRQRLVITSHEMPSTYAKHLPTSLRKLYYLYEKVIHLRADYITVHTSQHKEEILKLGVGFDKIKVLEHPVFQAPEAFSRQKDINRAVVFGRITPKKGIETLLEAMERLPSQLKVDIVGPAAHGCEDYFKKLKRRAQSMGFGDRVCFHGYVSDSVATEILSTASFAVFPYRYITQSGALLTSVGHGLPYIGTKLAAFVEFNRLHGGGLLVPVGDSDAMRGAVKRMWFDQRLGRKFRRQIRTACDDLSWAAFGRELISIYGTE